MNIGDIVCHGRHGVGIVLSDGQSCQVRFLGGKGLIDSRRLTVLLSADSAERLTSGELTATRIGDLEVKGATLWLRSADQRLRAVALSVFSASTDLRLLVIAERSLADFPPGVRSRVTRELSEARSERGLDPWPETLLWVKAELESRRLKQEAELEAKRAATAEAQLAVSVNDQIRLIADIRRRLGRPALSAAEKRLIEKAIRAKAAAPSAYRNHCWKCHTPLHSNFNPNCPVCGWLVCACGACRKPDYQDSSGKRAGACPQEAALMGPRGKPS